MNLAIRDIRRHKTRFLLTCVGLGLLLTVVMAMSGIYRGLIGDATNVLDTTPAEIWVVQKDTRGPFAESSRLPDDLEHSIAAVEGVRRASPISFQYVQIPRGEKAIRLFLIGYKLGGIGGPQVIVAGRAISKKHYEIVADRKSGYAVGDTIHLGLEDYTVVGLTQGMTSPAGDPVAFLSLADAQIVQFQLDNDAIRNNRARVVSTYAQLASMNPFMRDKATTKALAAAENPHFANAIVAELDDPSMGPQVANSVRHWNHYQVFSGRPGTGAASQGVHREISETALDVPYDPGDRLGRDHRAHHLHAHHGQAAGDRDPEDHRRGGPHDHQHDPAAVAFAGVDRICCRICIDQQDIQHVPKDRDPAAARHDGAARDRGSDLHFSQRSWNLACPEGRSGHGVERGVKQHGSRTNREPDEDLWPR